MMSHDGRQQPTCRPTNLEHYKIAIIQACRLKSASKLEGLRRLTGLENAAFSTWWPPKWPADIYTYVYVYMYIYM